MFSLFFRYIRPFRIKILWIGGSMNNKKFSIQEKIPDAQEFNIKNESNLKVKSEERKEAYQKKHVDFDELDSKIFVLGYN